MDDAISLLDHGFVSLIDHMGDDLAVSRGARVDPKAEWRPGEGAGTDHALINYMMKHAHTTPFENVVLKFHVKAPIFVFRQWHRHRTWTYDEISARYAALPDEYYVPDLDQIGVQSQGNRQGRQDIPDDQADVLLPRRRSEIAAYREHCDSAFRTYHRLLDSGWPRELARGVLPLSTYSRMFGTVDLHNLINFWRLRSDAHAQYEIRVYSDAMIRLLEPILPVTIAAWRENARLT
jgi:thymidylate synthase (FAD)